MERNLVNLIILSNEFNDAFNNIVKKHNASTGFCFEAVANWIASSIAESGLQEEDLLQFSEMLTINFKKYKRWMDPN